MYQLNAFHAAGECRRQVKNVTNFVKNVNIVEFHDHIWNHHGKCIQISTNMPSIGLVMPEITYEILEFFEKTNTILLIKPMPRVVSVKIYIGIRSMSSGGGEVLVWSDTGEQRCAMHSYLSDRYVITF